MMRTAVSVASWRGPKWRISAKCLRTGYGRSRGGWSPRIPPKTKDDHPSPGVSYCFALKSSMHTGSGSLKHKSTTLSSTMIYLPLC